MAILKKKQTTKLLLTAAVVCILLTGASVSVYAADIGGIQRTLQLWIHGDQTDAAIEISDDGSYHMTYQNEDGSMEEMGGGGIALEGDGSERPLTEEELLEHLNAPEVEYYDDGSVWVYYYDRKIDITDDFDEDGICYVKLEKGEELLYVTIKHNNGWSISHNKFPSPSSFNHYNTITD